MMIIKISPKGQITIPKSYRKSLDISPGDDVVVFESEGQLVIRPVSGTITDMRGIIQVKEPQDLEAVLEKTKSKVARNIVGQEAKTIFNYTGSIPPTEGSTDWEDIRAAAKEERAKKVMKPPKDSD